jgi:hypothetical protein
MFPLPGGYANVCDSKDAEEHGYSERNLGNKEVLNFFTEKLEHKKGYKMGSQHYTEKIYVYYIYVKIVREHKQLKEVVNLV